MARNTPYHVNLSGGFSGHNNPGAAVWYVGAQVAVDDGATPSDGNDGRSPQQAFATIQKGLDAAVAGRGDIVAVLPGSYTITAALTMTKADVTLMGAHYKGPNTRNPAVIVCATNSVEMLAIDAADVTVSDLTFDHNTATAAVTLIDVGDTTASPACVLRNLFLDMEGSATDTDGITINGDTASTSVLIEGCTLHDYDQDGIVVAAGNDESIIRGCRFYDIANTGQYAITTVSDNGLIEDCTIQTAGTAGIHANVALELMIRRCNIFCTGANTIGVLMAALATVHTSESYITAMAAGNVVDFTTSATVPSATIAWEGIDGTDPTIGVLTTATVGGT